MSQRRFTNGRSRLATTPSDLAVVGRYVLSENLDLLEFTPPGAGGEVKLTDAIDALMKLEQVDAYYMKGKVTIAVVSWVT